MALTQGEGGGYSNQLGQMSQTLRIHYETLAQQYFGMGIEQLVGQAGYEASISTLGAFSRGGYDSVAKDVLSVGGLKTETTFIPFGKGVGGSGGRGSPVDDLLGGNDSLAAKLFAQADAKARSAAARAQAEADRNNRETLKWEMRYGSFAMPFDVSKHINATVKRHGNMSMLLNMVYADKRFKKSFPGILDKSGDLKMSVGEYTQTRDFAKNEFSRVGIKINDAQFGDLIGKNARPEQIAERAKIAGFIKGNADLLLQVKGQVAAMNVERQAKGLPPLPGLNTMSDLARYVTKQGEAELYSTYEAGVVATAAQRSGLQVSTKRALTLAGAGAGLADMEEAEKSFKSIADQLRVAGVELGEVGMTQADLETIEFGGANRGKLAQQAEQVLTNRQAQIESEPEAEQLTLGKDGKPVSAGPVTQAGF